jgi:hypothetical protein
MIWHVSPDAMQGDSSERVIDLSKAKQAHKDYKDDK